MQFEGKKRLRLDKNRENDIPYPFWINFYISPPAYKVSLQEIEEMAIERLKILQIVDELMKTLDNTKRNKMYYEVMLAKFNALKTNNEKNFYVSGRSSELSSKVFDARKRDHISHFILRIFYCQTEELRRWFASRETELFRARFIDSSISNSSILQECLSYYGYKYEIVNTEERVDFHERINWMEANKSNLSSIAFKLKFEDAIELVRFRKAYLNQGYAYLGANEMITVICNQFRLNLSRELAKMHTIFYSVGEERLVSRLQSLHQTLISGSGMRNAKMNKNSDNYVSPEMIDSQSKELFPPCMQSIHDNLRKHHHLKHYGRLHYGLFLKAIGLSLEDSIEFFRSEFSIINPEKFQKEYSYTIRHIYGKEGKRVQLSAYSCQKIINEHPPGPNDSHGCPFRHFDTKNLKALLVRYGVNDETTLNEILSMASVDRNYCGACTKYFSARYNDLPRSGTIYHPNQFYTDARNSLYAPKMDTGLDVTISGDTTVESIDQSFMDETIDDETFTETATTTD